MTKPSTPSSLANPASGPGTPGGGWPSPERGDVLSYAYLWSRDGSHQSNTLMGAPQAAAGREEGLKDRPVVVVLAARPVGDHVQVTVAPVTHSPPEPGSGAVELPANVKRDLGLDRERSWIVTREVNQFRWPGPDVRLVGDTPYHGAIPDWLFEDVRRGSRLGRGGGGCGLRSGRSEGGFMQSSPVIVIAVAVSGDDLDGLGTHSHPAPMDLSGHSRITVDPAVCGGRPVVKDTRMRVTDVLETLAGGASVDEIAADFPYVTKADVRAVLAYAARSVDHPVVIVAE